MNFLALAFQGDLCVPRQRQQVQGSVDGCGRRKLWKSYWNPPSAQLSKAASSPLRGEQTTDTWQSWPTDSEQDLKLAVARLLSPQRLAEVKRRHHFSTKKLLGPFLDEVKRTYHSGIATLLASSNCGLSKFEKQRVVHKSCRDWYLQQIQIESLDKNARKVRKAAKKAAKDRRKVRVTLIIYEQARAIELRKAVVRSQIPAHYTKPCCHSLPRPRPRPRPR
jgi:hypothetical protein